MRGVASGVVIGIVEECEVVGGLVVVEVGGGEVFVWGVVVVGGSVVVEVGKSGCGILSI